jgi:hypothetical protein
MRSATASKIFSSAAWLVNPLGFLITHRNWEAKKHHVYLRLPVPTPGMPCWTHGLLQGKHCTVSKFLESQPASYTAAIFDGDVVVAAPMRSLETRVPCYER